MDALSPKFCVFCPSVLDKFLDSLLKRVAKFKLKEPTKLTKKDDLDMIDPREACDEQCLCRSQRHRPWHYDLGRQHPRQLVLSHDVYYLTKTSLKYIVAQ